LAICIAPKKLGWERAISIAQDSIYNKSNAF
jgi:hypothetical protein